MTRGFLILIFSLGVFENFCEAAPPQTPKINTASQVYGVLDAYSAINNCSIEDLIKISSLDQMKNICSSLIESPLCQGIDSKNLKNCDDIIVKHTSGSSGSADYYAFDNNGVSGAISDGIFGCFKGTAYGTLDVLIGVAMIFVLMGEGAMHLLLDDVTPSLALISLTESLDILKAYYLTEYEKANAEESTFPVWSALGGILSQLWEDRNYRYACMNPKGRAHYLCEGLLHVVTAAATGGFAGGAIAVKLFGAGGATALGAASAAGLSLGIAGGLMGGAEISSDVREKFSEIKEREKKRQQTEEEEQTKK